MTREDFAIKYGRGWWIFQGTSIRHNRRKTWIEQFNIEGESTCRRKTKDVELHTKESV